MDTPQTFDHPATLRCLRALQTVQAGSVPNSAVFLWRIYVVAENISFTADLAIV